MVRERSARTFSIWVKSSGLSANSASRYSYHNGIGSKQKLLVYCLSSHTLAEIKWNWTPKSLLQVHPWIGQTWQSNEEMKVQWCRQGAWSHHVWLPNGIQELGFGYRTFENKSWLNKMRQEILKPSDTISFRKTAHSMPSISVWIFSRLFSIGIGSGGSPLARLT